MALIKLVGKTFVASNKSVKTAKLFSYKAFIIYSSLLTPSLLCLADLLLVYYANT